MMLGVVVVLPNGPGRSFFVFVVVVVKLYYPWSLRAEEVVESILYEEVSSSCSFVSQTLPSDPASCANFFDLLPLRVVGIQNQKGTLSR